MPIFFIIGRKENKILTLKKINMKIHILHLCTPSYFTVREGPGSQPQSTLSCSKKPPPRKKTKKTDHP